MEGGICLLGKDGVALDSYAFHLRNFLNMLSLRP